MKTNLLILITFLLVTSCTSKKQLAATRITTEKGEISATLHSKDFLNPDGLVRRVIQLEYPDGQSRQWEIRTAHYSDKVSSKLLNKDSQSYLIAEDNTGDLVWDLQSNRVTAESGIGEGEVLAESGNATDYMAHTALKKEQWVKVLDLNAAKNASLTTIDWQ